MGNDALVFLDDDGTEVVLDEEETRSLLAVCDGLEPATVSACPTCHSRVIACVALVDLLTEAPPHQRAQELIELADDAPTLHLYVEDLAQECSHLRWHDPGRTEWSEALEELTDEPRGIR